MHRRPHDDHDELAIRRTNVLAHLDGVLDEQMLGAMQGVWSILEHAAADGPAHARAVRARMFWESLAPGGAAAAPVVTDLVASWDEDADADADADEGSAFDMGAEAEAA